MRDELLEIPQAARPVRVIESIGRPNTRAGALLTHSGVSIVKLIEYGVDLDVAHDADLSPLRTQSFDVPWLVLLEALPRELLAISSDRLHEPKSLQRLLRSILIDALLVWGVDDDGLAQGITVELAPRECRLVFKSGLSGAATFAEGLPLTPVLVNPLLASLLRGAGHWTDGPTATASLAQDMGFELTWSEFEGCLQIDLRRQRKLLQAAILRRRVRTPPQARRETILDLLRRSPQHISTNLGIRQVTGFSRQTVSRDLGVLERDGLLTSTEPGRSSSNQAWRLTERGIRGGD